MGGGGTYYGSPDEWRALLATVAEKHAEVPVPNLAERRAMALRVLLLNKVHERD